MKTLDIINANSKKIENLATPTAGTDAATKQYVDDNAPSVDHAYYANLAALIEPDAIEYPRYGTFTYAVASNETKYMILAWQTYIDPNAAARYDVRVPNNPLPLRNITIKGTAANSTAVFLDPTLPTYADARVTYLDRMASIAALRTRHVWDSSGGSNNTKTLLPGPYGSIITSVMCFDYGWVALNATGTPESTGFPIDYETNDSATYPIRFQHTMMLPITKAITSAMITGYPKDAGARGVITFVDVPSTWSAVTDSLAPYDFRDDFMGASIDTGVWTVAESTANNVEFDSIFSWLKMVGNGNWNANGLFRTTGAARSDQPYLLVDVHIPYDLPLNMSAGVVGWHDGAGHSYTDFAHGLYFASNGGGREFRAYENGNDRGVVGSSFTAGHTYRVRIRALSGGGASYEIQGGPQYGPIGGASWTTITPGTTTSATNTLHVGATTPYNGTAMYLSDFRVYTP
jgi:hypothetical protein